MGLTAAQIKVRALTFKKFFLKRYRRFPALLQDADDFEQHCLELMWTKQTIDLRFLWVATNFIESRQCVAGQRMRDNEMLKMNNSPVKPSNVFGPAPRVSLVLAFFEATSLEDLHKMHLDMIDRSLVLLTLKWGFRFKEIADLYGISQSSISARLKKIKAAVKNLDLRP